MEYKKMSNEKQTLLTESLKALRKGIFNLLLLKGEVGWGKTHSVKEYLEKNEVSYTYISGHLTPLKIYDYLYRNKDKEVIIFDDVQNIDNPIARGILRDACFEISDNRKVSYLTTSENFKKLKIPEKFKIKSKIILIFNNEIGEYEPLISRGFLLDYNFSFDEKVKILKEIGKEDEEVINFMIKFSNPLTRNFNVRTYFLLMRLKVAEFEWKKFGVKALNTDEDDLLLLEIIAKSHSIENACKKWCKATGKHRATFFRRKRKLK